MIGVEDSPYTFEYENYFKILPALHDWGSDPDRISNGLRVPNGFSYTSDNNNWWMSSEDLSDWVKINQGKIGRI